MAAQYREAVIAAMYCARLLAGHDLPTVLQAIEHADAIGPILDPTLWREKQKAMGEDRELLRAALPLHDIGRRLSMIAEAGGTEP